MCVYVVCGVCMCCVCMCVECVRCAVVKVVKDSRGSSSVRGVIEGPVCGHPQQRWDQPSGWTQAADWGAWSLGRQLERCSCSDKIRMPECSRESEETESRESVVGGSWCGTHCLLGQVCPKASEFWRACVDSRGCDCFIYKSRGLEAHQWGHPLGSAP